MPNINKTITIHLSEIDVKEIVADYLTKEGYKVSSGDVTISLERKTVGYGRGEHEIVGFKECTAVVKGE